MQIQSIMHTSKDNQCLVKPVAFFSNWTLQFPPRSGVKDFLKNDKTPENRISHPAPYFNQGLCYVTDFPDSRPGGGPPLQHRPDGALPPCPIHIFRARPGMADNRFWLKFPTKSLICLEGKDLEIVWTSNQRSPELYLEMLG